MLTIHKIDIVSVLEKNVLEEMMVLLQHNVNNTFLEI